MKFFLSCKLLRIHLVIYLIFFSSLLLLHFIFSALLIQLLTANYPKKWLNNKSNEWMKQKKKKWSSNITNNNKRWWRSILWNSFINFCKWIFTFIDKKKLFHFQCTSVNTIMHTSIRFEQLFWFSFIHIENRCNMLMNQPRIDIFRWISVHIFLHSMNENWKTNFFFIFYYSKKWCLSALLLFFSHSIAIVLRVLLLFFGLIVTYFVIRFVLRNIWNTIEHLTTEVVFFISRRSTYIYKREKRENEKKKWIKKRQENISTRNHVTQAIVRLHHTFLALLFVIIASNQQPKHFRMRKTKEQYACTRDMNEWSKKKKQKK